MKQILSRKKKETEENFGKLLPLKAQCSGPACSGCFAEIGQLCPCKEMVLDSKNKADRVGLQILISKTVHIVQATLFILISADH